MEIRRNKGFTLIELMIGLSLGVLVLTGLVSFFFRTSKIVDIEQKSVKDLAQLQFVLNKIAQDIKEVNTVPPESSGTVTLSDWQNLPYMARGRIFDKTGTQEIVQPPVSTYPKEIPTYPFAYLFLNQAGTTGAPSSVYPKADLSLNCKESNELTFYKVVNNQVTRVLYYTEEDPAYPSFSIPATCHPLRVLRLKRKQQFGILPTSIYFIDNTLTTKDEVIMSNIKYIQFTYPNIDKKLDASSSEYDSTLDSNISGVTGSNVTEKACKQGMLVMNDRNLIQIKIGTAGPQIGDERVTALELSTEVNVRN